MRTGMLETEGEVPSVASDGAAMISFDGGDASPADASDEFGEIVEVMGRVLPGDPGPPA